MEKFREHLRRQLGFLDASCKAYDAGNKHEAIRIATTIRVLIHDTGKKKSRSLLKHMGATEVYILNSAASLDDPRIAFGFTLGMITMGNGDGEYVPELGAIAPSTYAQRPASDWWTQVVYVLSQQLRLTRKEIVLTAANKDGGAHVDEDLTPEYEALATSGSIGSFTRSIGQGDEVRGIDDVHLVALRQMGYEILNSPRLLELASNATQ